MTSKQQLQQHAKNLATSAQQEDWSSMYDHMVSMAEILKADGFTLLALHTVTRPPQPKAGGEWFGPDSSSVVER